MNVKQDQEYSEDERARIEVAEDKAFDQMVTFLSTPEGTKLLAEDISDFLVAAARDQNLENACSELLLQGTASTWTAFEVLARDLFIAFLNAHPGEVSKLTSSLETRRRFETSKVSLTELADHNFDLSAGMGTFLARQQDLSDYLTIKASFRALFEQARLFEDETINRGLLVLSQQRHLIVHHRGLVDRQYEKALGVTGLLGKRLLVNPVALEESINMCGKAGSQLLELFTNS